MRRLGGRILDWLRSAPEPTLGGRLVLTFLVLSTIFAVLLRNNQVIFVTTTILATVLMSFLLTCVSASRLSVKRYLPRRVFAGAPFDVRLRVRNDSRWRPALGLGFLDALQVSEPGGITRGPALPVLPPRRTVEVAYVKRIHRRGVYTVVNTLAASSGGCSRRAPAGSSFCPRSAGSGARPDATSTGARPSPRPCVTRVRATRSFTACVSTVPATTRATSTGGRAHG
jgi:hypothetical protein